MLLTDIDRTQKEQLRSRGERQNDRWSNTVGLEVRSLPSQLLPCQSRLPFKPSQGLFNQYMLGMHNFKNFVLFLKAKKCLSLTQYLRGMGQRKLDSESQKKPGKFKTDMKTLPDHMSRAQSYNNVRKH